MSKKAKIIAGSIAGGVIAAAVAVIFIVIPLAQQGAVNARYEEAMQLINEAHNEESSWGYTKALNILEEINSDEFNVDTEIAECHYFLGLDAFQHGGFVGAAEEFELILDYKDAYELAQESWYQAGLKGLYSGSITAYECFEQPILKGYKDSAKLAEEARQLEFKWWNNMDEYNKQVEGYQKLK